MATKPIEQLTRNGAVLSVLGAIASGVIFVLLEGPPRPTGDPRAMTPAETSTVSLEDRGLDALEPPFAMPGFLQCHGEEVASLGLFSVEGGRP